MTNSLMDKKLDNSPFLYREKLTIPKNVNFGLEFELDKIDPNMVYRIVRSQMGGDWKIKEDESLTKGQNAEIVSPVLQNNKETWNMLKKLSEILSKIDADYGKCSFQVNFDGALLPTLEKRVQFLKFYSMYEDIIYRFSKGEDSEYRDSLDIYASPIFLTLKHYVLMSYDLDLVIGAFSDNKRYGIVFKSGQDLIEFRTPNMTNNPILWQNYINTFYYLVDSSLSNRYNKKEVDRYVEGVHKMFLLENYEKEKKEKALEFCDTVFTNSLDKINFMHQYLDESHPKKYVLK